MIENTTLVRVQSLPSAPTGLRVSDITPTSVKLTWQYGGSGGRRRTSPEGQYFVIQYKPREASWDYKEISGAITDFYDIRGLSPYTEYEFVVLAVNDVGRGPKSKPVTATTGETGSGGNAGPSKTNSSKAHTVIAVFRALMQNPSFGLLYRYF